MTSKGNSQDEVDFEFLGNREGKPITIQTNVFTKGQGNREQRFVLWFDPTEDFHAYGILWNPYHIVYVPFLHAFLMHCYKYLIQTYQNWYINRTDTKFNWNNVLIIIYMLVL